MYTLGYLGAAFILCTIGRFLDFYLKQHHEHAGKLMKAFVFLCYGLAFPVYGALQALESSINKCWWQKYNEAAKAAATIAAIETLPEDLREAEWRSIAWRNWHTNQTYDEWYADSLMTYNFDEALFHPSAAARQEILKLCKNSE